MNLAPRTFSCILREELGPRAYKRYTRHLLDAYLRHLLLERLKKLLRVYSKNLLKKNLVHRWENFNGGIEIL